MDVDFDHSRQNQESFIIQEEDVIFIVQHLNDPPFNMNLRLVDFHVKQNIEMLEIVESVLCEIGMKLNTQNLSSLCDAYSFSQRCDQQDLSNIVQRDLLSFFFMLKCPFVPNKDDDECIEWLKMIFLGEKSVLYPLLKWMLGSMEKLKKRAYLIPFLSPINIPQELLLASSGSKQAILFTLVEEYRSSQVEFKELHKKYDSQYYTENIDIAQTLKADIEKLVSEKRQLVQKIKSLQDESKVHSNEMFSIMFKTIENLRQAQQENLRFKEEVNEQREILDIDNNKVLSIRRYIDTLDDLSYSALVNPSSSPFSSADLTDTVLEALRGEVHRVQTFLGTDMADTQKQIELDIQSLEKEGQEPCRSKEEVKEVQSILQQLRKLLESKKMTLSEQRNRQISDEIQVLTTQVDSTTEKARCKLMDIKSKHEQVEMLKTSVRELSRQLEIQKECASDIDQIQLQDGSVISKTSLLALAKANETKMQQINHKKKMLTQRARELVILKRTVDILRRKYTESVENMLKIEDNAGISGFHQTTSCLSKTEEQEKETNTLKTHTLCDINDMIKVITTNLESKKESFKRLIQELKEARYKVSGLEIAYQERKTSYDQVASSLLTLQISLEKECDKTQEDWLKVERRYHFLVQSIETIQIHLQCAVFENDCENGKERYSTEFPSLHAWYSHQIYENKVLLSTMHKQLDALKKEEHAHVHQKQMFIALQNILQIKKLIGFNRHLNPECNTIPIHIETNGLYSMGP